MSGSCRRVDLTGLTFGQWRVVGLSPETKSTCTSAMWRVVCSCGHESAAYSADLRKGKTRACRACAQRMKASAA